MWKQLLHGHDMIQQKWTCTQRCLQPAVGQDCSRIRRDEIRCQGQNQGAKGKIKGWRGYVVHLGKITRWGTGLSTCTIEVNEQGSSTPTPTAPGSAALYLVAFTLYFFGFTSLLSFLYRFRPLLLVLVTLLFCGLIFHYFVLCFLLSGLSLCQHMLIAFTICTRSEDLGFREIQ